MKIFQLKVEKCNLTVGILHFRKKSNLLLIQFSDRNWSEPVDISEEGVVSRLIEHKGSSSQVLIEVKPLNGVQWQVCFKLFVHVLHMCAFCMLHMLISNQLGCV